MDRTDVVVIGAGVMGTATAYSLGLRGVDTVLLEQFRIGHTRGSSHGPTRIFRISYPLPDYARMSVRSLDLWRRLEDAAGETLLVGAGGLDCGPVAQLCAAALDEVGASYEWLSPRDAETRFAGVSFDGLDPILFQPDAAVCRADRTVAAQARLSRAAGVDIREDTEALEITPDDDGVHVRTAGEEIKARVAVVTAGPWAARMLGAADARLPLTPILQSIAYFRAADGRAQAAERLPTFIHWDVGDVDASGLAWYALPAAGVAPGAKLGQHVGGIVVDPLNGPFEPNPEIVASLSVYVRKRFPALDPEPVGAETCLYTMTPDEDFVVDRIGSVVFGAGFSGHGFKFAPLIGEVLADLATGRDPAIPRDRFASRRLPLTARPPPE
jgi:sarcosine oxidase